ncbi:DEAD/DEAH box helicase, partial [Patescibacteria group bacterium]|nr:DEAD/DEAH box helicase [Patescibacteria group bacterium]
RYERVEGDHKVVDQISRLLSTEEEALQNISRILKSERSPETNEWVVPSPRILLFVSTSLEALRELGRVELDASAERMLTVQPAEIEWDVQVTPTTGIDWFSFSFDWHCEQSALDPTMLKQAMGSDEPIIRLPDGRIVRIQNNDELQALLGWMNESGTSDAKTVRVRRYHVPELLFLTQSTRHTHFQQTDAAFERFMHDVSRGEIAEAPVLTPLLAKTLRPYQRDGVQWLQFLHRYGFGGVLADEMGLGKTVQVLAFLSSLQQLKKTPSPALIVCPKTLLTVWHEEAARFTPELRMLVIDGTPEERKQKLQQWQNADVVLTSYSFLQRDVAQYLEAKATFSVCVIDEAQFIKNARTQTSVVIKSIPSAFRIALTGTPIENGVQELWSLFDFLMPGFLGQTREFTEQYTRPIRERQDEQALARLRFKLKPFLLRRTKDVVAKELPPKIEQEVRCTLSPEQLVLYSRTLSEVRTEVQDLVAQKGFNRSQIEILAALTKLRRICDHPSFADSSLGGDVSLSGKLETTIELIHEALAGGHKILVFSQFTSMLDLVRNALDQEKIESVTIEGATRDRGAEIQRFRGGVSVFLLSLKAGGTGLTLTEADTVILIDPWWNPQVEKQAMDRAHRIGQTRPVTVYKLVSQQTIEERMIELQKKKQHIFDAMLEGSATTMESLTLSDIEAVLG